MHLAKLAQGETVQLRTEGDSMKGRIEKGQACTVIPARDQPLAVGDVVLCVMDHVEFLHQITAVDGDRFEIGDAHGRRNGWVRRSAILGKCVRVAD